MPVIDPDSIIETVSVEELCRGAELYYVFFPVPARRIATQRSGSFPAVNLPQPAEQLTKPFANLLEAPEILSRLGFLIGGLRLGKGHRVLDFGATVTISLDASETALRLGKRLFSERPPFRMSFAQPEFLLFNGRKIDLPDGSVDRIVCFDAFHHVPNQHEILSEMFRVLRDGGLAGFSEPGREHSKGDLSQSEMRKYRVLENDIVIEDIFQLATEIGFSHITLKPLFGPDLEISLTEYSRLINDETPGRVTACLSQSMRHAAVFFLHKGEDASDSRSHRGLRHKLTVLVPERRVKKGATGIALDLVMENTGTSTWLADAPNGLGMVRIGVQLYNSKRELISLDFQRFTLPRTVVPGETVHVHVSVVPPKPGKYHLGVDLVSEGVCWFENVGSTAALVDIDVE